MPTYSPDPTTIRQEINEVARNVDCEGYFLTNFYGSTLDGSDVADYLKSIGFEVIEYKDTGRNGLVTLANGVQVSTNGYASRSPSKWCVVYRTDDCTYQYSVTARTSNSAQSQAFSRFWDEHKDDIVKNDFKVESVTPITQ